MLPAALPYLLFIHFLSFSLFPIEQNDANNYDIYREIRKPFIGRLRWGKRDDIDFYINLLRQWANNGAFDYDDKLAAELDEQDQVPSHRNDEKKRAPSTILRWGRSYNSDANTFTGVSTIIFTVLSGLLCEIYFCCYKIT